MDFRAIFFIENFLCVIWYSLFFCEANKKLEDWSPRGWKSLYYSLNCFNSCILYCCVYFSMTIWKGTFMCLEKLVRVCAKKMYCFNKNLTFQIIFVKYLLAPLILFFKNSGIVFWQAISCLLPQNIWFPWSVSGSWMYNVGRRKKKKEKKRVAIFWWISMLFHHLWAWKTCVGDILLHLLSLSGLNPPSPNFEQSCRISSWLAADWSRQITWPEYWPVIGHKPSQGQNLQSIDN